MTLKVEIISESYATLSSSSDYEHEYGRRFFQIPLTNFLPPPKAMRETKAPCPFELTRLFRPRLPRHWLARQVR
jgi:hypothetical protein